jgi:cellulose synthase/poly-beta-1,6-N-acetylglucosamine synthase-like glycosyltransferase
VNIGDQEYSVLDDYFKLAYAQPHDVGLQEGNLKIAEDRIPSLLSVIHSGKFSHWVDGAVFYFEAELNMKSLITQRRRWGNGTFAGHGYVMGELPKVWSSGHPFWFKIGLTGLVCLQVRLSSVFPPQPSASE